MDIATIARLLGPYAELTTTQLEQTLAYIELLAKWNAKINLTSVRDPEDMVTRHFGESFFAAARLVTPGWEGTAIDVGSGAGFPGLPLAMAEPKVQMTLIEANNKKAAFLNEVVFALKLGTAKVFKGRAEEYSGRGDLVTMRGVEKFERSLPVALGLVTDGGRLALMIGSAQVELARALATGMGWQEPMPVPGGHSRVLLVGTKSG